MVLKDIENIFKERKPNIMGIKNKYGITIPLINRNGSLELIYELRASTLRRQPGEISFPGGRIEKGETFKEGAIRECMEELCIDRENISVLGEIDIMITEYKALIHTFVVLIDGIEFEDIKANKGEVEKLFTIPIDFLMENSPKVYDIELEVKNSNAFPYDLIPNGRDYEWDLRNEDVCFYKYEDYVIWGLTGKLTRNFIDIYKKNKK